MIDRFQALIPQSLMETSGSVFYSGRSAFGEPSKLYILGLNPGGSPQEQAGETINWHTRKVLTGPAKWSAYADERWKGKLPGTHGLQPRILHLLNSLHLDSRCVPSSNVVFVRSAREAGIDRSFSILAEMCWPFHQAVIEKLGVRVVLCFGQRSGDWVCSKLDAVSCVDRFVENNNRRWSSNAFMNRNGLAVVVATHPSIADWTVSETDPSPLMQRVLQRMG